jgi:hypothetical protein
MSMMVRRDFARRTRLPLSFQQLCVLALEQIRADITIDNAEWKARIKDRLLSLNFDYPEQPDAIDRAMRAVEASLVRSRTPRPPPSMPPSPPGPAKLVQDDPPWRSRRSIASGLTSLSTIVKSLFSSITSAPSSPPPSSGASDDDGAGARSRR